MSGKKKIQVRKPDYFDRFRCTASDCTDNCCIGWEIDIDERTAERYKKVPGELGQKLKDRILWEGEDELPHFILQGERCPFLGDDNLCQLIRELGENSLCDICREHPRFYEWFDGLTEMGLGLCCEAAAKLILESPKKTDFVVSFEEEEEEEEEAEEEEEEEEEEGRERPPHLFASLLEARGTAFALLQNREYRISERLALYLMLSEDIQDYLDLYGEYREALVQSVQGGTGTKMQSIEIQPIEMQTTERRSEAIQPIEMQSIELQTADRVREVLERYGQPEFLSGLLCDSRKDESGVPDRDTAQKWYADTFEFLRTLEPVSPKWPSLLNRLMEELPLLLEQEEAFTKYFESREYEYEHLAVYFTYRYFLKSYFDCDLLSKAVFAAAGILIMRLFAISEFASEGKVSAAAQVEIAKFYSRELEYSLENLAAFSEETWFSDTLCSERLIEILLLPRS